MKKTTKRFMTGCVAVALAAVTAFGGFGPTVAQAAGLEGLKEKDTINYVSLGDSMTNGYGLPGYDGNTGVEDYGNGSYANLFADWLAEETDATVNHAQLAMSAMRAEDLHWLLEFDYTDVEAVALTDGAWDEAAWNAKFSTGDYWTYKELCDNYRFAVAAYAIENDGEIITNANGSVTSKIYDEEAKIVAEYYQTSVKNADIISVGIGNGNFGVFAFGRIMEAIGFDGAPEDAMAYDIDRAIAECDPEMQTQMKDLMAEMYAVLEEYVGLTIDDGDDSTTSTLEALANTMVYTGISYVLNYAGSVEAILQLNSDAEIILVPLMNTMETDEEIDDISLGGLMEAMFVPMNAYIAALPTYMQATGNSVYADATFYYAEADFVECMVETYGDDFYKEDGTSNPDSTIRKRFVADIIGDECACKEKNEWHCVDYECKSNCENDISGCMYLDGMVWGLLSGTMSLVPVTFEKICAYDDMTTVEQATYAAIKADKAMAIAVYLAFEDAIKNAADGAPVSVDSVLGLGNLSGDVFGGVLKAFEENAAKERSTYVDVAAGVVAGIVANKYPDYEDLVNAKLVAQAVREGEEAAAKALVIEKMKNTPEVTSALGNIANALNLETELTVEIFIDMYETGQEETWYEDFAETAGGLYNQYITQVTTVKGLLVNNNIVTLANSLCTLLATPNALSKAVQEDTSVQGLLGLFARCIIGNGLGGHPSAAGHEALAAAVKDAYGTGYTAEDETIANAILAAEAAVDLVAKYYDEAYAYAYQEAKNAGYIDDALNALDDLSAELDKIDVSELDLSADLKAELENTIENAQETIEQLKDLIEEADVLDQATLEEAIDLLNKLGQNVTDIRETLTQAGYDLADAAWDYYVTTLEPAIKEALQEAVEVGTQKLLELIDEAYDAMVEALTEAAKEYAPEVADYIYNWLYNNPDKVIAFFEEYGDDMVAFMEEYQEEIFMVLGFLISEFGDDVVDYVMENPEEVLDTLVWFYETHGENTWKLIMVYADALGITDALEAGAKEVYKALEQICDYIEGELAELEEIIEAEIAKIEAEIEALKAELEKAGEDAKELIEAEIAKLEAELASLVEQLEAYIEESFEALYQDATTGEYVIDTDSAYVSLGDSVAASKNTFAGKLADTLASEYGVDDYTDLAIEGFRAEDIRYILDETYELDEYGVENTKEVADAVRTDYIAEIEASDLITIAFGNDNFTTFTAAQIAGANYEMDWARFVTEAGVPYVEEALAKVSEELMASGLDAEMAATLAYAVECYAYGFAGFSTNYTEVLNEIHAINPNAQVVVVGMFNPIDAFTMDLGDGAIALGEYVDYFISMSNQMFTIYSAITPNTTFVPVPDTEATIDARNVTSYQYLMALLTASDNLLPSDSGHKYIKEQILNAMTITVEGLKGDVNLDGRVSAADTAMLFDYVLGKVDLNARQMKNADVNEDTRVSAADTAMLFDYVLGKEVVGW